MNAITWAADGSGGLHAVISWGVDEKEDDMVLLNVRQDTSGTFVWSATKQDTFNIHGSNIHLTSAQAEAEAAGLLGVDYWKEVFREVTPGG